MMPNENQKQLSDQTNNIITELPWDRRSVSQAIMIAWPSPLLDQSQRKSSILWQKLGTASSHPEQENQTTSWRFEVKLS